MNCKIRTFSIQSECDGTPFFGELVKDLDINISQDFENEEKAECFYHGDIFDSGEEFYVIYDECGDYGLGETKTTLRFSKDNPKEIYIKREGETSTDMFFSEKKRHVCVYNTQIMPFELCFYTKSVDNRLATDGFLQILYIIEIKGACVQKVLFRMEIEKE